MNMNLPVHGVTETSLFAKSSFEIREKRIDRLSDRSHVVIN